MPKHHQKQYIDIPINIEETPTRINQKLITYQIPNNIMDIAKDLIMKLQQVSKTQENQQMNVLSLYHNYFAKVDSNKLGAWPSPSEIQAKYEQQGLQFNIISQTLYNQLTMRNRYEKLKDSAQNVGQFLDAVQQAWENYESIFQHESKKISMHAIVIWDLFESFLYQFSQYHFRLANYPPEKINQDSFNIQNTKKLLQKLSQKIPAQFNKNSTSQEVFSYYALLANANIQLYEGNFQAAIDLISRISLTQINVYSKSFGALLNLYLITSYSHFMLQQYHKAARLCQMVLLFYQKNKKYLSSIQWLIVRQIQKIAGLLCICYTILQQQPKNIILDLFKNTFVKLRDRKDKERMLDKFYKLKQNDENTFTRLFNHCCLPVIGTSRTLKQHHQIVFARFKKLESITLNTIIHHYTQISIKKVGEMLNISEGQARTKISQFNEVSQGKNKWDLTVMNPLLGQRKIVNIEITENDIVKLQFDTNEGQTLNEEEWEQYRQEITWLSQKIQAL